MHNSVNVPSSRRGTFTALSVDSYRGVHDADHSAERAKQRVDMALRYFGERVEKNAKDARALFYLGMTLYDAGRLSEAEDSFLRYLEVFTYRDEAYQVGVYLTKTYIVTGELEKAESVMASCIPYNPSRPEGFALLGRIAHSRKRYKDAVSLFAIANSVEPVTNFFLENYLQEYDINDRLSMSLFKCGRKAEALQAARAALSAPTLPAHYRERIENNLQWFEPYGGAYYDKLWERRSEPVQRERLRVKRMCEMLGSAKRVLDFGCGPGWPIEFLAPGTSYVGVDSSKARDLVAAKGGHAGSSLEDAGGTFDGFIIGEVIEHLEDPEALLREVREHCRAGATGVISVPQYKAMVDPAHVRDYTPEQIAELVSTIGTVEAVEEIAPWQVLKCKVS